jgi:uncharacterized protein (TIGR02646 family)
MRPVNRGPNQTVFKKYGDAKQELVNRLGMYCSYCERRIPTLLAVEHIQPKALPQYAHLETAWENFLLGCTNCNSAKSKKPVELDKVLIPDRDNTFVAFVYDEFGQVAVAPGLSPAVAAAARDTIDLVALNRDNLEDWDDEQLYSALERVGQRTQALTQCWEALADYEAGSTTPRAVAREAAGCGFFSLWMAAFHQHPKVRKELIKAFTGTDEGCFDAATKPVSPRPVNGLANGSKI